MAKILIADKMSDVAAEILRGHGLKVDVNTGLAPEALGEIIGGYDGLAVRSATTVTAQLIEKAERLRVIGRAGIGVDNIDLDAATARGIVVMNTPSGNAVTTAEHAIAMMCAMARQIPQADRSTRASRWEKSRFLGIELCEKTLGLIGCGNIGAIVATLALGLKMRVIVYDPYLSAERARGLGVELRPLDALLAEADIISLHVPLTDETRNMLDAAALAKARPGVRIVNCARGGLVVEADLKAAIEAGHVAGAALDVFETEPAVDNPLFELDQVITTPHLGAATAEAQRNVAREIAEQIAAFLTTGAVVHAVNMPSVAAEEMERLGPYMKLAEQLGSFAGQLTQNAITAVTIEYEGTASGLNTRPLTAVALKGLLSPQLDSVNMVNAPVHARARGIDVREIKREQAEDYQTFIRLSVTTEAGTRGVAGTLIGSDKPRIVEIKGIKIEAELGPHMLYITNDDRPGLIGLVGSILGEADVNIATFSLGRSAPGGDALGLISVDSHVTDTVLDTIRDHHAVLQVQRLDF